MKTHDYMITLFYSKVPQIPLVCDGQQTAVVPVSGWAQVTLREAKAHDHHRPPWRPARLLLYPQCMPATLAGGGGRVSIFGEHKA